MLLQLLWLVVLEGFNIHKDISLLGVAQDFMSTMTTMGLSQAVSDLTHVAGHILDLIFCTRKDGHELDVEELSFILLSLIDHCLVGFRLMGTLSIWGCLP